MGSVIARNRQRFALFNVNEISNDRFEIVALYTDFREPLPESEWITTPKGKVLKDMAGVNSYIALNRFGVNAQPNYVILDSDGNTLAGPRGYNLSIPGFVEFLQSGLKD